MRYRVTCRDRSTGEPYALDYDARSIQAAEHLALLSGHDVTGVAQVDHADAPGRPGTSAPPAARPDAPARHTPHARPPADTRAIIGLALGCVGILASCVPIIGLPVNLVGLVFGILSPQRGGVRTAGIIVCSAGLVLTVASGVVGAILASRGMIP